MIGLPSASQGMHGAARPVAPFRTPRLSAWRHGALSRSPGGCRSSPASGGSDGGRGGGSDGRGGGGGDEGSFGPGRYGLPIIGGAFLMVEPALAKGKDEDQEEEVSNTVDALWETYGPFITTLGFSGLVGLACAGALKVVGKSLALAIGLVFAGLQFLKSSGYIEVNWGKVQSKLGRKFDVTGDKIFDEKDVKTIMQRLLNVVSEGVPSVGGFLGGFVLGLKVL